MKKLGFAVPALVGGMCLTMGVQAAPEQARIVGGWVSEPTAWPWMVEMTYPGADATELRCGGTLIHPQWVLTAAHCYEDDFGDLNPSQNFDFVIGKHNLTWPNEVARLSSHEGAVVWPGFTLETMDGDVALVKLPQRVSSVPVVKITGQTFDMPMIGDGTMARAIGWGSISGSVQILSDALREVDVPITDCGFDQGGTPTTRNMICAGYTEGGKDACQGDSGGPLVTQGAAGEWTQIGITSFGVGCAEPGYPGVYTRLSNFAQWISDNVCAADEKPTAPELAIAVNGNSATATIGGSPTAQGFRLYFAPVGEPIRQIQYADLESQRSLGPVTLPSGAHYYAAAIAYRDNCLSPVSNLVRLDVQ